jgi:hypothetical protein
VLQPQLLDEVRLVHMEQQGVLSQMLERTFGADPRFRRADLAGAIDLADRTLSFDGMHLTSGGIKREVTSLIAAVGPEFLTSASRQ